MPGEQPLVDPAPRNRRGFAIRVDGTRLIEFRSSMKGEEAETSHRRRLVTVNPRASGRLSNVSRWHTEQRWVKGMEIGGGGDGEV